MNDSNIVAVCREWIAIQRENLVEILSAWKTFVSVGSFIVAFCIVAGLPPLATTAVLQYVITLESISAVSGLPVDVVSSMVLGVMLVFLLLWTAILLQFLVTLDKAKQRVERGESS